MFFLKLMRKLAKLVRGGVAPRQIVLGAVLGVLLGMVPGFNLSLLLGVLLLLILNAHIGIALMGFAIGTLLMLLLAPVTFRIGFAMIHQVGLEGVFRWFADIPVVALMDLHVYSLVGGIPVAVAVGLVFAWLMVRAVTALRKGIIEAGARSERMRKLANNPVVRLFSRIVFGKRKEDIKDLLQTHPPLFRKAGVGLAAAVLVIVLALEIILLDPLFAFGLKKGLEKANGAEVNVTAVDLSLAKGKLTIAGLQITDPENPENNTLAAGELTADIDITDLLRKRFVVDILSIRSVAFDTERASPGQVFAKPPAEKRPPKKEKATIDYLEKAETVRNYLRKLQNYLETRETKKKPEKQPKKKLKSRLAKAAEQQGYLPLSAKNILVKHPAWMIRQLELAGMKVPGLAESQYVAGSNISSQPRYVPEPMSLVMAPSPESEPSGRVDFHFHDPEKLHAVALNVQNLSLGEGRALSKDAPIAVESGTASVTLRGRFSSNKIDFPFRVRLSELNAETKDGQSVLGMDPEVARKVLEDADNFTLVGAVRGSLSSPKIELDISETLASLKGALGEAAKKALMQEAGKQIEKAVGGESKRMGDKLKKALGGSLFGGDKDGDKSTDKKEDSEQEEERKSPLDKLGF